MPSIVFEPECGIILVSLEIAGVAAFDTKKEQALVELEQVRAKIEREELLLEDYARRLEELSAAREDAVKYQNLKKELDQFEKAILKIESMNTNGDMNLYNLCSLYKSFGYFKLNNISKARKELDEVKKHNCCFSYSILEEKLEGK